MMKRLPAILWLLTLTAVAVGESNLQSALSDMRSEDYATRQRATTMLLANDSLSPQELQTLYAAATLPEQRQRILDVARHHMVRKLQESLSRQGGAGSLGLSLVASPFTEAAAEPNHPVARVGTTYPGFPAYVALKPGDQILSVNGQTLPAVQDEITIRQKFIELIQSNRAGAMVRLGLLRQGKPLEISVRLASFDSLSTLYEGEARLRPPFDAQWNQLQHELTAQNPAPEPLKISLDPRSPPVPDAPPAHLNQQPPDTPEEE